MAYKELRILPVPRVFCLEAGDMAGKTTLANGIVPILQQRGWNPKVFREPGGSSVSEQVRGILKKPDNNSLLTPTGRLLLFFAAREQLLKNEIIPFLKQNKKNLVILDRFYWSTLVYQGMYEKIGIDKVIALINMVCAGFTPSRTIYLDLPPAVAMMRKAGRAGQDESDYYDKQGEKFLRAIRKNYLHLATEQYPNLFTVVNAQLTPDKVLKRSIEIIEAQLYTFKP